MCVDSWLCLGAESRRALFVCDGAGRRRMSVSGVWGMRGTKWHRRVSRLAWYVVHGERQNIESGLPRRGQPNQNPENTNDRGEHESTECVPFFFFFFVFGLLLLFCPELTSKLVSFSRPRGWTIEVRPAPRPTTIAAHAFVAFRLHVPVIPFSTSIRYPPPPPRALLALSMQSTLHVTSHRHNWLWTFRPCPP